ncbi:hypothetical protein F384_08420 [Citrobacter amalonaticus Y19]|uniref:Uncharacterized protein n=1 Tax=Citrobacter amalonaticus Y19 TaxID=1261127 RepID=A0A0F6REV7_CITAM|nr:hypothetical protein F384_08420 [Citrobacter amalonaticus Y19]
MLTLMLPAFQANQRSGGQGRLSVSALAQARARRDEAKKKLSEGVNPEEIKDRLEKQVGLIIHGGYLGQQPTMVVDLTNDSPIVLREGVTDVKSPLLAWVLNQHT